MINLWCYAMSYNLSQFVKIGYLSFAIACVRIFPIAVASTGPAYTGMPSASAVN